MELLGLSQKVTLSIEETAKLFGIGEHKITGIINENSNADFVLWVGSRARIKRKQFEQFIDRCTAL